MDKVISNFNKGYMKSLAEERNAKLEAKDEAKQVEFLKALADDKEKQKAYAEGLVGNVNYNIEANVFFTDFLQRGSIQADERTWYYTLDEPLSDNEARVYEVSNHGQPPREAVVMERDVVRVTPYWITSPEVSMHKFSLRQGDITNEQKMRQRVGKAITWDVEDDAKAIVENGLTNDISSVAGIDIDSRIKTFPNSNDLDMSTQGSVNIQVLKGIFKHFAQLNKGVQTIYVPVDNLTDFWDFGEAVSDANYVPEVLVNQIVNNGTISSIFGKNVNLVPINTLNGDTESDDVYIWVSTGEPAGHYRVFPNLGSSYTHEDARRVYYSVNRAQAMFQTPNQRLNYARVKIANKA